MPTHPRSSLRACPVLTGAACAALLILAGCGASPSPATGVGAETSSAAGVDVRWVGQMHKAVHEGDSGGKIRLSAILSAPHAYAIGPVEGLRGEITVIDGAPFIGVVAGGRPAVSPVADPSAAFLVWAHVPRWRRVPLPDEVRTQEDLEAFVPRAAEEAGLGADGPFPFCIEGVAAAVEFHIIWQQPGEAPGIEAHERAKVHGRAEGAPVRVVGFFSRGHRGVFTPSFSDLHMHADINHGSNAGHVDSLRMAPGGVLLLPEPRAGG